MTIIKKINKKNIIKSKKPLVIGYFGCIHKGHLPLFKKCEKFNVMTFLNLPKKQINQLYFDNERLNNLKSIGAGKVYVLDLAKENFSANDFINQILIPLAPSKIIVGNDFRFGKNATGDEKLLLNYFDVNSIDYNDKYSTTKIKHLIMEGEVEKANSMLVKNFSIFGKQKNGNRIGRKQGWPTINVDYPLGKINLKLGSYVTYCYIGKKRFQAITFIGNRELTSNTYGLLIESHIINAKNSTITRLTKNSKKLITIEFLKYIRAYTRFATTDLLKEAISSDYNLAKEYFKKNK